MPDPEVLRPFEPDPEVARALDLRPDGSRRRRRWPWVVLALAVVAATVAVTATRVASTRSLAFDTVPVTRGDLVLSVTAVGTVEPRNAVDVASELSGVVAEVLVDVNQEVTAGQVLARLDTVLLEAHVQQARAQVRAAEASLEQARVTATTARHERERAERLHREGVLPDADLERAQTAHKQAVAALGVAEGNLGATRAAADVATTNLEKAQLRAPMDGIVLDRQVEPGQAVVSALQAQTLFRLAEDLDRMEVVVDVDEADIARVAVGQRATFTVAAHGDREFEAIVAEVKLSPSIAQQVVTYEATLHTDNPDRALVPGMTATAELITAVHEDALLVPNEALRFAPSRPPADLPPVAEGHARVWAPAGEDGAAPVDLVLGPTDGTHTIVQTGLTEGDPILTAERARRRGEAP